MEKRVVDWRKVRGNRYRKTIAAKMLDPEGLNEIRKPKGQSPYFVHYDREYVLSKIQQELVNPLGGHYSERELIELLREAYRNLWP